VAGLQRTLVLIRDVLGPVAWWQILLIAGMAGLSEEVLFRGVVQREFGLLAASVLFGLCHPLSMAYVIYASLLGLYMGVVAKATGGLVAPILVHALYDAVGLWYLTRRWQPAEGVQSFEETRPGAVAEDPGAD
jgi:membrane protease YdiL (CAAX protease family)